MSLFLIQNISTILSQQCFGLYTVIRTETENLFQALDLKPKIKGEGVRKTKSPILTSLIKNPLDH